MNDLIAARRARLAKAAEQHSGRDERKRERRQARMKIAVTGPVDYRAVIEAAAGRCAICGVFARGPLTMDHIIPIARGGAHTQDNLQALCRSCNSSKGARTMEEVMGFCGPLMKEYGYST